jgi:3'-5' exoribonuclease
MEVEMVNQKIAMIPDFPAELAMLVKHMLVSHHGAYEFGFAQIAADAGSDHSHTLNDLDGKIQAIQSLPEEEPGSKWTAFHRAYGRSFFRGGSGDNDGNP